MKIIDLRLVPVPFNPADFFGDGYGIIKEAHDPRGDAIDELNFALDTDVTFITPAPGHEGERLTCGEAFSRLTGSEDWILYGANIANGLYQDYLKRGCDSLLESLREEKGIDKIHFFGDVISIPEATSCILMLSWVNTSVIKEDYKWRLTLCSFETWPFEAFVPAKIIK